MIVKLTVTTECGAKCITCPNWQQEKNHMSYGNFVTIWDKIIQENRIEKVILNNVGDVYYHPECVKILKYITRNQRTKYQTPLHISLTTNGSRLGYIPANVKLIISFNGGNQETYEKVTGLDFYKVIENIRYRYNEIKKIDAEIHVLIFQENKESEKYVKRVWSDFPGIVRISYKYDNQGKEDLTLYKYKCKDRVFCNYLDMLNIDWNGNIITCAHDWKRENVWGNMITDDFDSLIRHPGRIAKIKEQGAGKYTGICEKCNYNIDVKKNEVLKIV